MTSAAQPQQTPTASQQQPQPNPSYTSQPPIPAQAQNPASPPNKRDLKSWWKQFKIPTKHQEANGTYIPFFSRSVSYRSKSLFLEDMEGVYKEDPPSVAMLQQLAAVGLGDNNKTQNKASASPSLPSQSRQSHGPTLDALARILTWRYGRCTGPAACKKRNSFGAKLIEAEARPLGIFGVPLRQSITYANVAISLIDENGKSYIYGYVPIVVAKCGVFLKEKATEIEGIFRLSGSEKRIKELKTIFDSPDRYGKGLVWDGYTVHDAANVLRRYLNDLPEPVVPLDLYEKFREPLKGATRQAAGDGDGPQFVENFDMDQAIARYQQLITELPPLNRQLLLYILDLLAVFAAKSDQNRMNSQNLAAIFQPGMLSHPNHAMAPEEYRLNQCVIIFLIENQDNFLIGMQGTAADENTVREVQKGTPVTNPPATPVATRKPGVTRSSSSASAGAESVAKDGQIRRNKSTSSRRSMHSNGAPSPGSPALATTPTSGGLGRSNTVPSKKSPHLQSGRFANRNDHSPGPMTPLTPMAPTAASVAAPPPAVVKEVPTPQDEIAEPSAAVSIATSSLAPGKPGSANRSQEKLLLDPNVDAGTPSKERRIPSLFQRSPTGESEVRQPNKLRKKRLPGDPHTSAHSSTTSLPYSHSQAASPNTEAANPLEAIPSRPKNLEPSSLAAEVPTPSESTPRAPQPTSQTLHPNSGSLGLKTKMSPPTSLHSSFNEGSDNLESPTGPPAAAAANPSTPEQASEKEKKSRWRLSRKQDPPTSNPSNSSPRKVLGTNSNAEGSTSTVGSSSNYKSGHSMTGDSEYALGAGAPGSEEGGREGRDDGKGIAGWLKSKYREKKENFVDPRRNKSPPAIPGGERGTGFLGRGKSLDLKRSTGQAPDDARNHPLLSPGLPKENQGQLQQQQQPPPLQPQVTQPAQQQQQSQPQPPTIPEQPEKESQIGQAQ
ncbi:RhoGAP domain-protein [Rhypophila decipiens]|uniref:RhoGAP domain-protein n=1 Tax=Rhypophila decipiens TaxID=261697 RepID=A0AAN6YHD5_9PEZI|nr:RhoGAP domain-protein [Rhypophila decipiens]